MEDKYSILRKKLLSLDNNISILTLVNCRIYTCLNNNDDLWYDSGLEGIITYSIDHFNKTIYFILHDQITLETTFKFEVYKGFNENYQVIASNFHCFEINNGFIGFKFENEQEATIFSIIIKKFDEVTFSMLVSGNISKKNLFDENTNEQFFLKKIETFKRKSDYHKDFVKFNHQYSLPESMIIRKINRFQLINDFKFDKKSKRFLVDKISLQLRKIFYENEFPKIELNDKSSALKVLKQLIMILDEADDIKTRKVVVNKFRLFQIIKTRDMASRSNQKKTAYKKSVSLDIMKHTKSNENVEIVYEPLESFMEEQVKTNEITHKNEQLPVHKKILYHFPKIPDALHKNVVDKKIAMRNSKEFLAFQIENFKVKAMINEVEEEYNNQIKASIEENRQRRSKTFNIVDHSNHNHLDFENKLEFHVQAYENMDDDEEENEWSDDDNNLS